MSNDLANSHERRIDRIEARFAIERLVADYAYGYDERDEQRFVGIFHDDGEYAFSDPATAAVGHDAIRAALRQGWEQSLETHHWITNVTVDFIDDDHASGDAQTIAYGRTVSGVEGLVCARYRNQYSRRDGAWRAVSIQAHIAWYKPVEFTNLSAATVD